MTLCAAISHHGVLHHHATLGPYNTQHLLDFLNHLYCSIIQQEPGRAEQPQYVVIWDNVSFHHAALVHNWFNDHPRLSNMFLPAYFPFLNPIEEFFLHGGGKFDRNPYERENLLQAIEEACGDIAIESIRDWIRHNRAFSPLPCKRKHLL